MIKFLKSILKILKKAIKKEHMRGGIAVYFKKLLISGFLGFLFSQPSVNVNPSSLISNLLTGEAETQSLIISNTGSNELSFSVNVVTSETRWSFPEINYQGAPTVPMIQNMQNLWVDLKESSSVSFIQNDQSSISRSSRNWQLLASDPQDNDSPYDTKYVYYELTDTSLNFKYEYYDPWEDPLGNTAAILYLNIDSSPETGITDDNLVGIDMLIYSVGDNELDGVYIYLEENYYGGGFVRADNLLWSNREPNTNKFSFGFSNEFFEGLVSMPIASISGSLNYQPDLVPNEGMLDLLFGPNWLSVVPDEGQVLSEEFLELDVAFDATGLYGGVYQATIEILSNDPETQQLDIPVVLTVTGAPDILVSDEIVDFGTLYTNYGGSKEIIISNDGTDVLEISSITIDNTSYTLSLSEAVVPYNDEVILTIDFMPLENGEHNGHLTIISNDVDEPQIVVPILGSSIAPPIISVNPSSLSSNLLTGETETQFLTISNNGNTLLDWSTSIGYVYDNFDRYNSFFHRSSDSYFRISDLSGHENDRARRNKEKTKYFGYSREVSERDSRDIDLNIGDIVLSASLNGNTISLYKVNQSGDVSFLYSNIYQALVVENGGAIVFVGWDGECGNGYYNSVGLKRLKLDETIEHIACLPVLGEDFDKDDNENIIYLTFSSLYRISPDGGVETVVENGFDGAKAVAVHPETGDYFIALDWYNEIIRVTPQGEVFFVYQNDQMFSELHGLAFTEEGTLIIVDEDTGVFSLNDDGVLEMIAQGGILDELKDVVVDQEGNYIVSCDTYEGYASSLGSLVKVTPEGEVTYLVERYFEDIDNIGIFSRRNNWLSVVPDEGQVLSEEFLELDVAFDATGLYGGVYQATIEILSNDPETQQLDIPVVLTVTGAPDILVSDEIVDFGTLYTNYGGSKEIIISNDGTDVLEISSITIDNTSYILSFSEAVVPYNDEVILTIDFMPLENGEHNGHLTIISNDVDEPQIVVPVLASSIAPPIISVNPSSLSSNLLTGETETQFLTISNNGESDLSISVSTINVNSRSSMLIPDPGVATNRLKTEDLKNLWNIDNTFSSESALTRHLSRNNSRPMRNWQLLANDPQDYGSPYDTENIYYEVTDTTLNFKYEYYESWESFYGNTIAVLMFDIDNDLQTGLVFDDYGMIEGIDMVVYSTGLTDYYGIDGVYVFDSAYDDLIQIDNLSWENRENNTNEFSFGIPFEYFRGLTSMTVASQSGSLNEDGPDIVPNEGMVELFFGVPWLSIQQEDGTISEGSVFDLGVVFDATGLFGGDYEGIINIRSNDPVYPVVEIPVYLNVTGVPIVDFPTEVDFGQVFVGYPDTLEYTIANIGTDLLLVENISFQDTWLSSELGNLSIAPLEHISLNLVAQINNPDTFVTNMSFTTNDLQNTVVEDVIVSAMSVYPPEMNISQSEFVFTHTSETSETNEFVITNTGGSSLQWQIEFESLSGSLDEWFFFEKIDFSDFASEENQDRITDNVWIARENSGPFFNYYLENVPEYGCDSQTPSGTLWSPYSKENSNNNSYVPFIQMTGCCPPCIVGDTVSVWLLQDDLKLNVVFSSWTSGGQGGGFSYHREQVIPQWIEFLPTEGVVDVDGSQEIFISVNSFGLQQGEHSTVLLFNSNDPEFPSMPISVDLVYVLGTQDQQTPKAYALYPTYPNPFNPSTIIQFDVPKNLTQNVGLYVFDIRGKLVETILDKELSSGSYSIRWDAKSKSSGVYFLRMVTDNYIKNRKMILMK